MASKFSHFTREKKLPIYIITLLVDCLIWLKVAGGMNLDSVKYAESLHVTKASRNSSCLAGLLQWQIFHTTEPYICSATVKVEN